jgi:hypothetical protein
MQEKMHVRVDQAGHQGAVPEIDDFRARGMFHTRSHLGDAVALNQDFAWLDDLPGFDIQQPRGMQDHGTRCGLRCGTSHQDGEDCSELRGSEAHDAEWYHWAEGSACAKTINIEGHEVSRRRQEGT